MYLSYEFDYRYTELEKILLRALTKAHLDLAFDMGVPNISSMKCTFVFTPDPIPVSETGMNVMAYEMSLFDGQAMTELRMKYYIPLDALSGWTLKGEVELLSHEIAHAIFAIMEYYRQLLNGTVNVGNIRRFSNNEVHVIANDDALRISYVSVLPYSFRYYLNGVIYTFNGYLYKWDYPRIESNQAVIDYWFNIQKTTPQPNPLYF